MCGMFAQVRVDNSIELPHFPEELDRDGMTWQSKRGLDVYGGPYRITEDGRLEKKKQSYRDKTEQERQAEAEKWGFDSWDEYIKAYEQNDDYGLYPDGVNSDEADDDSPPVVVPSKQTLDKEWWADISQHGSFEFHQAIKKDPIEYEEVEYGDKTIEEVSTYALDVYLEYEAQFEQGDLTGIVFMGSRMGYSDDPIGDALSKIEEWRENR